MEVLFEFDSVARKPKITSEFLSVIREHFSVEDKALAFMRRRTGRMNMPVRKYAITNKGYFELPFIKVICEELAIHFPNLKIKIAQDLQTKIQPANIVKEPVKLKYEPRNYQFESAFKALTEGMGIIVLPTSAGKTLTIALIVGSILQNTKMQSLILVPNIQLVEQTYNDFLEYGIEEKNISKWTGNYDYTPASIVIANNQILLSKTQDVSVLNNFDVIVCDEVHKIGTAEKISKLVKNLKAPYKFGFTGSMPSNNFDVWSINKIFGPIIYKKTSTDLRENNYISKVRVVALEIEHLNVPDFSKPSLSNPTAGYIEEIEWLHTNIFRNNIIRKVVNKLETNTLVLVDRIAHGEILFEFLKEHTTKKIYFIQGSVEVEEREKMRTLMEQESGVVCIAISKIFSTGISIKNLHNVIFASIGKAKIKIIQSIGRSLRLHHSKEIATIFDLADVNLTYGFKHFEERKELYISENIPIIYNKLVEK